MARPRAAARCAIVPLDAEATATRTETEASASPLPSPLVAVEPEPAPTQPERTPERQRLADSIEAVRSAEAEIAEASVAAESSWTTIFAAQRTLDAAEAVLKDARPRDAYDERPSSSYPYWGSSAETEDMQRRIRAADAPPPISIADAKAAVEVAKDALHTARRTRQHYEDRQKSAGQNLTLRQVYVRDAVRDVLRSEPATLALAQRCRRLTTQAAATRAAFAQIVHGDVIQAGSPFYAWDMVAGAESGPEAADDWSIAGAWRGAIAALVSDPDAPLPAV